MVAGILAAAAGLQTLNNAASRASGAVALFAVVVILLGLVVMGAIVLLITNRLRKGRNAISQTIAPKPLPDPWKESGRRTEPYDTETTKE